MSILIYFNASEVKPCQTFVPVYVKFLKIEGAVLILFSCYTSCGVSSVSEHITSKCHAPYILFSYTQECNVRMFLACIHLCCQRNTSESSVRMFRLLIMFPLQQPQAQILESTVIVMDKIPHSYRGMYLDIRRMLEHSLSVKQRLKL